MMVSELFTKKKRPILVAGPCSAETETQVIETATRLNRTGKVDMIRAGIWKPRTRRCRCQRTTLVAKSKRANGPACMY
jgi:3-deoxy-D-arabino-heptulosonate 7-phosphate (DAHP) synthase